MAFKAIICKQLNGRILVAGRGESLERGQSGVCGDNVILDRVGPLPGGQVGLRTKGVSNVRDRACVSGLDAGLDSLVMILHLQGRSAVAIFAAAGLFHHG